jgi:PKD repeat protein
MAESGAKKKSGWLKAALVGVLGLGSGAAATYATAIVERVAKPARPVANFAVSADGLTVTCRNHASGESGWWDFGDGTPLEPFDPAQPTLAHTYAKPGNYTVKLTVRNFVADENERSVPVEVAAGAKESSAPAVLGFAVQPVSPVSIAPATFRVTADVQHAEHCVWDFGDGRMEVAGGSGKIDRMVTFDRPGDFTVQLVAHNDRQAVKLASPVNVQAPKDGTLTVVLRVTDTGSQSERVVTTASVAIPTPKEKATGFTKVIPARPGYTIAEAGLASAAVAGVKNLKVQIAADRRSATLSGEWAGDSKAVTKAAGGSDVIVPVKLTHERVAPIRPVVNTVTGSTPGRAFASPHPGRPDAAPVLIPASFQTPANWTLQLPTPPAGLTSHTREYQVELRQVGRREPLLQAPAGGKGSITLPWSGTYSELDGRKWVCSITPDSGKLVVTLTPLGQ